MISIINYCIYFHNLFNYIHISWIYIFYLQTQQTRQHFCCRLLHVNFDFDFVDKNRAKFYSDLEHAETKTLGQFITTRPTRRSHPKWWFSKGIPSKMINWVVVSNISLFPSLPGEMIPILTNIFQMGWNHQLAQDGKKNIPVKKRPLRFFRKFFYLF